MLRRCGQLGHLTKQCRNQFSRFFDGGPGAEKDAAQEAAAAAGVPTAAIAMAPLAADAGVCLSCRLCPVSLRLT